MLAHLSDQMRHALGDAPTVPRQGPLRWPLIKPLAMFWLPWPKGRVKGPREAFVTRPTSWDADLAAFVRARTRLVKASGLTSPTLVSHGCSENVRSCG